MKQIREYESKGSLKVSLSTEHGETDRRALDAAVADLVEALRLRGYVVKPTVKWTPAVPK